MTTTTPAPRDVDDLATVSTPQAIADRYGVPLATVYRWRTTGYGPRGFRVGKFVRYRREDVLAWEAAQIAAEADR